MEQDQRHGSYRYACHPEAGVSCVAGNRNRFSFDTELRLCCSVDETDFHRMTSFRKGVQERWAECQNRTFPGYGTASAVYPFFQLKQFFPENL